MSEMKEGCAGLGLNPDDTATVFRTLAETHDALSEARAVIAAAVTRTRQCNALQAALHDIRRYAKAPHADMEHVVMMCGEALAGLSALAPERQGDA